MAQIEQQVLFNLSSSCQKEENKISSRSGTFTDNMKLPVHRWFRYSAGFSAEWAEQVIREKQPSVVLDPFAGSGTTLLAAEAAGIPSFGYESHPFIAKMATVKTNWNQSEKEILDQAQFVLKTAQNSTRRIDENIPKLLNKCYIPEILEDLFALRDAFLGCSPCMDEDIAGLLWLAITAILRSCSFVGTAQWQYVLPNKRKAKVLYPFEAFQGKIKDIVDDIITLKNSGYASNSLVLRHDARCISSEVPLNSVDLVLTSPPYPNNYDYADATRLEMTFWGDVESWGGLQKAVRQYLIRSCSQHATAEKLQLTTLLEDPFIEPIHKEILEVCEELGKVRLEKGGKKAYHTMVASYFGDLAKVFHALHPLCAKGCNVCFVVGDSAPYGVYVPVDKWLGTLAVSAGFKDFSFEKIRDRNIKWKNRKHRVPLHEGRLWING